MPKAAPRQRGRARRVEGGWRNLRQPLEHQNRTYEVGADMENVWPLLLMQRMPRLWKIGNYPLH